MHPLPSQPPIGLLDARVDERLVASPGKRDPAHFEDVGTIRDRQCGTRVLIDVHFPCVGRETAGKQIESRPIRRILVPECGY